MPVLKVDYNLIANKLKHSLNDNKVINELQIRSDSSVNALKYANQDLVKQLMSSSDVTHSDETVDQNSHLITVLEGKSDLIANQYEGGFRLWEGMEDMIHYFIDNNIWDQFSSHENLNILELGCGSGLAAIYLSRKLPKANFYLQDFNEEVVKYFTSTNVLLNNERTDSELISGFNYLFGDWSAIAEDIKSLDLKFDLIFTSETLYNCDNYEKLVTIFKSSLSPNGSVYIASKSHYFGVGGGSFSFMDFIGSDPQLGSDICREIDATLIRHIVKVWLKL